ncbi:DNA polymerase Y family protein [Mesorhizobium sp. BE184]|uniref:Y-family DNA polymerase n=1 Tax=Mesorhizobium sp. BE184 TaxID=2817714 RepID=UPI00286C4B50|nr:DNA polymerase Y family protein [Mesorhizobium sp. BE184]
MLSLWFPYLSTDRIWRQRLGRAWLTACSAFPPLLVSHRDGNAQRIAALDHRAEMLKLKRGMGVADARAMHPSIEIVEADPEADRRLLEGLADWCDRYTPLVALDGTDGLFLDITGCSHLFGGEEPLVADMLRRFSEQGLEASAAVAATAGTAWAITRFRGNIVVPDGVECDWLSPLPPAALRLDGKTCTALDSVGLRTIEAVMAAPRAPLVRRFGKALVLRLDQALGRIDEALSPRMPLPELSAERPLAEPVMMVEDIERIILLLAIALQEALERRGVGALGLRLFLFRVDGAVSRLSVHLSQPARAADRMAKLFHERLAALGDSLDAGCGFDLVRLAVESVAPLAARQVDLGHAERDDDTDLAMFVDRVCARLGRNAVRRPVPVASHMPERAVAFSSFANAAKIVEAALPAWAERPMRLLRQPEHVEVVAEVPEGPPLQFRWRRAHYRIARAEGPERISPEWWLASLPPFEKKDGETDPDHEKRRKQAAALKTTRSVRDYFQVEDTDGRRYWLYRQGSYGNADSPPRWFLHGIFA